MTLKLGVVIATAIAALAIGAAPASADQSAFGCITTGGNASGGSLLYVFRSSPGDEGWATDVRTCLDAKGGANGNQPGAHPQALR